MPVRTTRQIITVPNGEESQLKITLELELNINLNSNGIQASVTAKDVKAEEEAKTDDGFGGFVVPTFEPTEERIEFGKRVEVKKPKVEGWSNAQENVYSPLKIEETYLKSKQRSKKESGS